ncbi:MAG: tRNA 2-selenouridine(34) synthase MnmH [Peptococcaceae bacterium]|nr:tRNA 2-selenouridine(34) synthase MnmH [Peptococcaceae bacterium]
MVKNICIEDALIRQDITFVDVRSESEFLEGSIPGAVNISILDNEDRIRVGTEYKQVGAGSAKRLGLDLVGPKIVNIVNKYYQLADNNQAIAIYCWRGGLRSKIMANILDLLDFNVFRITGGYKAYRRHVNTYFEGVLSQKAVVLHGLTGAGKTIILQKLAERGLPVLDLESLAIHRGSVYGKVGLPPSPSQKNFEAQIYVNFQNNKTFNYYLVECESKRLGKLIVPDLIMNSMRQGIRILIYAPVSVRVDRSLDEYVNELEDEENKTQLIDATKALARYLGKKEVENINQLIEAGRMAMAVEILLKKYYDPLYKYPGEPSTEYDLSVDATDIDLAVERIYSYLNGLFD